jgi:hypothetical protein
MPSRIDNDPQATLEFFVFLIAISTDVSLCVVDQTGGSAARREPPGTINQ